MKVEFKHYSTGRRVLVEVLHIDHIFELGRDSTEIVVNGHALEVIGTYDETVTRVTSVEA